MEDVDTVVPAHYPELARIAWNRDLSRAFSGEKALGLYEANWRHVDVAALPHQEFSLIKALTVRFYAGRLLTTK